jgi:Holliday junction resolvasome RuvABC endonuclease subunit
LFGEGAVPAVATATTTTTKTAGSGGSASALATTTLTPQNFRSEMLKTVQQLSALVIGLVEVYQNQFPDNAAIESTAAKKDTATATTKAKAKAKAKE